MTKQEAEFERRLEIFRSDVEQATQFLYAYLAIHGTAGSHKEVVKLLNTAPLFWNTVLGALQKSAFIALGRLFDRGGSNLKGLLEYVDQNRTIFSKSALSLRMRGANLNNAHVLNDADLNRLKRHEKVWRDLYFEKYAKIRSRVFAHNVATDSKLKSALFAKTNIREMQQLLVSLRATHEALWQLYRNGRKPVLKPQPYSLSAMLKKSSKGSDSWKVQERIVIEAKDFLKAAIK